MANILSDTAKPPKIFTEAKNTAQILKSSLAEVLSEYAATYNAPIITIPEIAFETLIK